MNKQPGKIAFTMITVITMTLSQCTEKHPASEQIGALANNVSQPSYNGFESQIKWGEHLVLTIGCNDCHTPKKMTDFGPVLDSARWLSGHPIDMPSIEINRKEIESKGLGVTADQTEWIGPWGVSYASNLTPDPTGIGSWDENQFIFAMREGKTKGVPGSRAILPPMPWQNYRLLTDHELKAVFAYLKSIKPINNLVPQPLAPMSMAN